MIRSSLVKKNKGKCKKILLINPPRYEVVPNYFSDLSFFARLWTRNSQPVGLLRIGTFLREKGHRVSMINCGISAIEKTTPFFSIGKRLCGNFKDKKIFSPLYFFGMPYDLFRAGLAKEEKPHEIYVTSFFTYQWEPIHKVIEICKEIFPDAKIILGGTYATLCPQHAKKSRADSIYVGEFAATNNCRSALDLLEEPPNYLIVKFSRGCPYNCSFCAVSLLEGHKMRYRAPADIVEEIGEKIERFKIRKVVFWESNVLYKARHHLESLLDLMIKRKMRLEIEFPEGFSPVLLDETILDKLQAAGLKILSLALETSNDKTLIHRMKKMSRFKDFQKIAQLIKKKWADKLVTLAYIMAGLPQQEIEEVETSVKHVVDLGILPYIMPFTPIPKTQEYALHFDIIRHKSLEQLHPLLWPCVNDNLTYHSLTHIHTTCLDLLIKFIEKMKKGHNDHDHSDLWIH